MSDDVLTQLEERGHYIMGERLALEAAAEIRRLRLDVDRLNKKCSALALLHYGSQTVPETL